MAAPGDEYTQLYNQLRSQPGMAELGDTLRQDKVVEKIQKFLDTYPNTIPMDKRANAPYFRLSLQEVYRRSLQTAIDIVKDISVLLTNKDKIGSLAFRRSLFEAFTKKERRFYVGIWLVVLSFILYFIDSAA